MLTAYTISIHLSTILLLAFPQSQFKTKSAFASVGNGQGHRENEAAVTNGYHSMCAFPATDQPEAPSADHFATRGELWFSKGEYDKAMMDFDESIRIDPKNVKAIYGRGCVFAMKQNYEKAIKSFDEIIQIDPNNIYAWLDRGNAYSKLGKFDMAIKSINEAVRLDPKNAHVFTVRAVVWIDAKEYDKAIKDGDEAIRLNPMIMLAYQARGVGYHNKGEYDKAIQDLSEAIRLDPKDPMLFYNRIISYGAIRDWEKAVQDGDELVRLRPKDASSYRHRGLVHFEKRNWSGAVADFDEAIRLNPKESNALANRAVIRAACPEAKYRDAEKAMKDAKAACELTNWKFPFPLEAYAAACAESGDFAEALKWQKKVLEHTEYVRQKGKGVQQRFDLYEAKKPYRLSVAIFHRPPSRSGGAEQAKRCGVTFTPEVPIEYTVKHRAVGRHADK